MMKMKRWLLGTVCCGILAMTGCGGSDGAENTEINADEYVQAAMAMLEEADSFAADFTAVVDMGGNNATETKGNILLAEEPLMSQVQMHVEFDDGIRKSGSDEYIYLEEADGMVSQYMNYDGQWTEMTMEKEHALQMIKIYNGKENMLAFLRVGENWTAEETKEGVLLTAVIPGEKFYDVEAAGRLFQLTGMSGLSEVYYDGVKDVPVTILLDEKTGEPVSFSVDLAEALGTVTNNVLTELSGGISGAGIVVEEYMLTSELTQLGDVEIEPIPEEGKSDAINYEKEISMLENE